MGICLAKFNLVIPQITGRSYGTPPSLLLDGYKQVAPMVLFSFMKRCWYEYENA